MLYRWKQELLERLPSLFERGPQQLTENPLVERFIRTRKEEHVDYADYQDMEDAWQQLTCWLEVEYMTQRIHSALECRTPAEFEAACSLQQGDSPLVHA